MTATTASARGTTNRRKGLDTERQVARYLREHGWPDAERAVRTGVRTPDRTVTDPGDLTGVPFIVSIKNQAREDIAGWFDELDGMIAEDPAALGFLIQRRRGKADPGRWWAWCRLDDLVALAANPAATAHMASGSGRAPVRLGLAALVDLLADSGWTMGKIR